jgi:hypothetical protein
MTMFNKATFREKSLAKLHSFVPEATIMAPYQILKEPQEKAHHRTGLISGLGLGSLTLLAAIGLGVGYGIKASEDNRFTDASKARALAIIVPVYGVIKDYEGTKMFYTDESYGYVTNPLKQSGFPYVGYHDISLAELQNSPYSSIKEIPLDTLCEGDIVTETVNYSFPIGAVYALVF